MDSPADLPGPPAARAGAPRAARARCSAPPLPPPRAGKRTPQPVAGRPRDLEQVQPGREEPVVHQAAVAGGGGRGAGAGGCVGRRDRGARGGCRARGTPPRGVARRGGAGRARRGGGSQAELVARRDRHGGGAEGAEPARWAPAAAVGAVQLARGRATGWRGEACRGAAGPCRRGALAHRRAGRARPHPLRPRRRAWGDGRDRGAAFAAPRRGQRGATCASARGGAAGGSRAAAALTRWQAAQPAVQIHDGAARGSQRGLGRPGIGRDG